MPAIRVYYLRSFFVILFFLCVCLLPKFSSFEFFNTLYSSTRIEKELDDGSIIWSGVSSRSEQREEFTISRGSGFTTGQLELISRIKHGEVIERFNGRFAGYAAFVFSVLPVLIMLMYCAIIFDREDYEFLNKHRLWVFKKVLLFLGYSDQEVSEIGVYLSRYVPLPNNTLHSAMAVPAEKGTYISLIRLTKDFFNQKQN